MVIAIIGISNPADSFWPLTGKKGMNCPTKRNAGTAINGWGSDVNTHHNP